MGKAGKLERVRDMVIRKVDKVEVLRKEWMRKRSH